MDVCTKFLDAQPMSATEKDQLYWGTATAIGMDL